VPSPSKCQAVPAENVVEGLALVVARAAWRAGDVGPASIYVDASRGRYHTATRRHVSPRTGLASVLPTGSRDSDVTYRSFLSAEYVFVDNNCHNGAEAENQTSKLHAADAFKWR